MSNLAVIDYEEEYDEFDEDEVNSPDYVDYYFRRKADWEKRVQDLFKLMESWLPKEVRSFYSATSMSPDALMKKFEPNKKTKPLSFISFYSGLSFDEQMFEFDGNKNFTGIKNIPKGITEDKIGSIYPHYQWVAGNNGQLSFMSHKRDVMYNIIDRSEKRKYDFNPPVWVLSIYRDKYIEVPLNKKMFLAVLKEMSNAEVK